MTNTVTIVLTEDDALHLRDVMSDQFDINQDHIDQDGDNLTNEEHDAYKFFMSLSSRVYEQIVYQTNAPLGEHHNINSYNR